MMNKSVMICILPCILATPLMTNAAVLTCSTLQGSGSYAQLDISAKQQTPGWIITSSGVPSSGLLLLGDFSAMGESISPGLWLHNATFEITSYDPDTGTTMTETTPGLVLNGTVTFPNTSSNIPLRFYPHVRLSALLRVDPAASGYEAVHWTWDAGRGSGGFVVDVDAAPFFVLKPSSWTHPDVVDMGTRSTSETASFVFSANPTPATSALTLSFNMDPNLPGSNSFRVNGSPGTAGIPLQVDGNPGPTLLEVIPSGVEGPFKGTVTATLTCL